MGKIIDGKALSVAVKDEVRGQVQELEARFGRKPCLCVIIVGENPASQVYVRNKVKAAAYTGMDSRLIELPAAISEEELLSCIRDLNADAVGNCPVDTRHQYAAPLLIVAEHQHFAYIQVVAPNSTKLFQQLVNRSVLAYSQRNLQKHI